MCVFYDLGRYKRVEGGGDIGNFMAYLWAYGHMDFGNRGCFGL